MIAKPCWEDAPDWANYIAMDRSQVWYWHETEPTYTDGCWSSDGKIKEASSSLSKNSLEIRPGSEETNK